jgi:hypothetical protein
VNYKITVTMKASHVEIEAPSEEEAIKTFTDMIEDGDFWPEADDYIVSAREVI